MTRTTGGFRTSDSAAAGAGITDDVQVYTQVAIALRRTQLSQLGTSGCRWACEFVANGQQLTYAFVVGAEVLGQ